MNLNHLAIGSMIICLLGVALIYVLHSPLQSQEVPIYFKVVEGNVGLLVEPEFLHFGHMNPGGSSVRRITLIDEQPTKFRVLIEGPAKDYVVVNPIHGELNPGESQEINFTLRLPQNIALGEYEGLARVNIYSQ